MYAVSYTHLDVYKRQAYAYGLHLFPEERAKLEANHDPELAVNAMHEIIRWQTPLAHMRRTATEDTELFGHQIKKRDKICLLYTSRCV